MKALALFSGGLDSGLAIKVVMEQGIEVIPLNFVSYFFGGPNPKIDKMALQLGTKVEFVDFQEEHRLMVENPPTGYGKHLNPCIDCHSMMIRTAGTLFKKYNADFVITGEVLGQRPMSQNYHALKKVEQLSGMEGLVVRPLSAKLLPDTIPGTEGWIDVSKLLDIQGRSRKRQMALAASYGLTEYPSPAGGCLLTDPNYCKRLRVLKDDNMFKHPVLFSLIHRARFLRLAEGKYIFVGRNNEENLLLEQHKEHGAHYITGNGVMGPDLLLFGENFSDEELEFAGQLFSRYSKVKGTSNASYRLDTNEFTLEPIDVSAVNEKINTFLK